MINIIKGTPQQNKTILEIKIINYDIVTITNYIELLINFMAKSDSNKKVLNGEKLIWMHFKPYYAPDSDMFMLRYLTSKWSKHLFGYFKDKFICTIYYVYGRIIEWKLLLLKKIFYYPKQGNFNSVFEGINYKLRSIIADINATVTLYIFCLDNNICPDLSQNAIKLAEIAHQIANNTKLINIISQKIDGFSEYVGDGPVLTGIKDMEQQAGIYSKNMK